MRCKAGCVGKPGECSPLRPLAVTLRAAVVIRVRTLLVFEPLSPRYLERLPLSLSTAESSGTGPPNVGNSENKGPD